MAWSSESAVNSQLIEFHSIPASQGRNKGLHLHVNLEQNPSRASAVRPGASAVRSQVEDYRAKAKECARLTVVTKSLREGRRYRKLAEMYWALALGEEIAQRSVFKDDRESEIVMTTYPTEFHRRFEKKWERRADAAAFYESTLPWLLEIGRTLRAELDAVEQPVSERLAAMLKELERPTAT